MAQGKGILQPHHLLDELENIIGEDEGKISLSDGPFSEVLKSAQVCLFSPVYSSEDDNCFTDQKTIENTNNIFEFLCYRTLNLLILVYISVFKI